MNIKHIVLILLLVLALIMFSTSLSKAYADSVSDLPSATMLANTCAGCHGTHGSSVGPASPTIAGISRDYFIETMQAYQTGERPATIMGRIARGYSEKEIGLMADYFSTQPFVRQPQDYDAKHAELGKKLHIQYCEMCHAIDARSGEGNAGILAGQWQAYLRFNLEDFNSGKRPMDKMMKTRMDDLVMVHGQTGINALINYYASQQ